MNRNIAVVGLGYVGLPLAVAFGKKQRIVGFDVKRSRIEELQRGIDRTGEVSPSDLCPLPSALPPDPSALCPLPSSLPPDPRPQTPDPTPAPGGAVPPDSRLRTPDSLYGLDFTSDPARLRQADFIIVAVPTPIDKARRPDLTPLIKASETVGRNLAPGAIVVYESTVYPGCTEEDCVPILERESGLVCGKDFFVGYSPERINPGDKVHRLDTVIKIVAGQTPEVLDIVASVYEMVATAGVHRASSIKTAEAAKVIENTQRDLNIALVNELSMIFDRIGIDTIEVLEAAGTKWNFLPFRPGLVGGHCIGVDPYYLTHKAEELGYHPQVILAGRRINDGMAQYVASQVIKKLIRAGACPKGARVGILGLTFKEDVPDLRNSKVFDIIAELQDYGVHLLAHEPVADPQEIQAIADGLKIVDESGLRDLDALVIAVPHKEFKALGPDRIIGMLKPGRPVFDLKSLFKKTDFPVGSYWRL